MLTTGIIRDRRYDRELEALLPRRHRSKCGGLARFYALCKGGNCEVEPLQLGPQQADHVVRRDHET